MAKKKDKTDNETMLCFRIDLEDLKKLETFIESEKPKIQGMAHTKSSYARYLFYLGFEKELKNWKEPNGNSKK